MDNKDLIKQAKSYKLITKMRELQKKQNVGKRRNAFGKIQKEKDVERELKKEREIDTNEECEREVN